MRLILAESRRFPELTKGVADKSMNSLLRNIAAMLRQLSGVGMAEIDDVHPAARLFADSVLGMSPLRAYPNWEIAHPVDAELTRKVEVFIRGYFREIAEQIG